MVVGLLLLFFVLCFVFFRGVEGGEDQGDGVQSPFFLFLFCFFAGGGGGGFGGGVMGSKQVLEDAAGSSLFRTTGSESYCGFIMT